jgi:hypothetical protein
MGGIPQERREIIIMKFFDDNPYREEYGYG